MKHILIIQENGRHKKNRMFRECFSLQRALVHHGAKADVWGLGHSNYDTEPEWDEYDLIINLENYDETGWVPNLREVKALKFLWSIDAHVKGIQSYMQTAINGRYNLILQATPQFVQEGSGSIWFPNCYDDDLLMPIDQLPKLYDVGFCGNVCNRGQLIEWLKANVENFRFDEFVIGDAMVRAINHYKVHWNCNIGADINYRNFETMGCRTALLTSANPNYRQLGFVENVHFCTYGSIPEMQEKIQYLVREDGMREELAKNGYEFAKANHTYKNRAQHILERLDAA